MWLYGGNFFITLPGLVAVGIVVVGLYEGLRDLMG